MLRSRRNRREESFGEDLATPMWFSARTALPPAGTAVMRGARAVGGHAATFSWEAGYARPALIDGAVGLALIAHGQIVRALGFAFRGDRIIQIEVVSDPERLRYIDPAGFDH